MTMRWLAVVFLAGIVALQVPMWFGKGGWLAVRDLDRQVAAQRGQNEKLKARNEALEADVRDLKTGTEAIEERARSELGHDPERRGVLPGRGRRAGEARPGAAHPLTPR